MEQQRFFLFIALAIISFLLWDAWQQDFGPKPVTTTSAPQTINNSGQVSTADIPEGADTPAVSATSSSNIPQATQQQTLHTQQQVIVETDVLRVVIDTLGGDVRKLDLLNYPVDVKKPEEKFRLLNDSNNNIFIAQSGFARKKARENSATLAPNHNTIYKAQKTSYQLAGDQQTLEVPLSWVSKEGVEFNKVFIFKRGEYLVDVKHVVNNKSKQPWYGNLYQQLQRKVPEDDGSSAFIYTYTGGVYYSPEEKYQKYDFGDMDDTNLSINITGGWAAMIQHYFLGAWIPSEKDPFSYYTRKQSDGRYVLGMKSANEYKVDAGNVASIDSRMFVGPKLQDELEQVAPGLELTVDYGSLTFIAKPLFWLLDVIHNFVGNWGWAIILLTIIIKLVFYKLSEASYRSMANMRKVQPRMQALKERYGSDKQKLNQALMDLYKKEKINPLGGCLPILIQIPVFIALYWVLLESVELRQAPWVLWIQDMSSADPYFILPVIMGVTMFIQQKLNPAPLDPMQAKIMMMLPIVFTVFFAFFPAGLVLYWVANNILSIAQQWYITRIVLEKA